MPAAPGQGDLMAAMDAVAEDVDFDQVTRIKPAEISSSKLCHGRGEVSVFFKELLCGCESISHSSEVCLSPPYDIFILFSEVDLI